jgi:hypothetical protein
MTSLLILDPDGLPTRYRAVVLTVSNSNPKRAWSKFDEASYLSFMHLPDAAA